MADSINTINVGGIDKEVEDTVARASGTSAASRCTALESSVSNLSARVEEIIAPTGEAPNPAEVVDARITVKNEIKSTLGNAIRDQINDLVSALVGDVLATPSWEVGRYNKDTGAKEANNSWIRTTDYITYDDRMAIVEVNRHPKPIQYFIWWYDSNHVYINESRIVKGSSKLSDLAIEDAAYFTIAITSFDSTVYGAINIDYADSLMIVNADKVQSRIMEDPRIQKELTYGFEMAHDIYGGDPVDVKYRRGRYLRSTTIQDFNGSFYCFDEFIDWDDDYYLVLIPNQTYIAFTVQGADGSFYQSSWITSKPYHDGDNYVFPLKLLRKQFVSGFIPSKFAISFQFNNAYVIPEEVIVRFDSIKNLRKKNSKGLVNHLERTQNLFYEGNQVGFTKGAVVHLNNPLPPGTYTLSADTETESSTGNSLLVYASKTDNLADEDTKTMYLLPNTRSSVTFTTTFTTYALLFYSEHSGTLAEGVVGSFKNIQVESGQLSTEYVPPTSLVDHNARKLISAITADSYFEIKNRHLDGGETLTFTVTPPEKSQESMIIFCDAKFTRSSGVTDYPRIRMNILTDKTYNRGSTWYRIGKEGEYEQHEWRAPSYIWDNRPITISIVVPSGCTLDIRTMRNYYNNAILRTKGGLQFFGRTGDCNICPDETMPSLQMAFRHGYNTYVVIPKISSDGQWFAYHDDTWDIATTKLRNTDGSVISDNTYDGRYFHEIPFSYLQQFDWGIVWGNPSMAGVKGMKLEDYFEFCAKTGMAPRFSMHPTIGIETSEKLTSLRNLVDKYGLLDKLTILRTNLANVFPVFGNDIGGYCTGNSVGSSWDGSGLRIDDALTAARSAKQTYDITVPISCGMWADGLFSDLEKAEELVGQIRYEGFNAGVFSYAHTGIDGSVHTDLWSEDIRWLASIGVTEFTDNYNISNGLNW